MTLLEVLDSAVKIGLGALIAGVSALLLSRSQHRRELDRARIDREFQLLKDVAEQTERFTQASLRHWALSTDAHRARRLKKPMTERKVLNLAESNDTLFNIFHELTSSEAKLLLLGNRDAQQALRVYGEMVIAFRRSAMSDSETMSDAEIDTWRANILKTRERLLDELHRCYRQLGS
ncbi:hypothetical protein [Stenotrophomonas lactitubi]|uniref:hypothetical protein n=1 Tax=Stenotrophomonas lactitubi TaxID=2045214 RepID=UPI00289C5CD7|nr:hypothetical protein [Stenotrophomonas lactitubi]